MPITRGMTEKEVLERLGEPKATEKAPDISAVLLPKDPDCRVKPDKVLLYDRWFGESVLVHLNSRGSVECVETGRMVIYETHVSPERVNAR